MRYKFCPECGKKLVDKEAGDEGLVPYCDSCKKYWFDSFASCVIILVANEYDEIVLLKQSYISDVFETFVAGYIKPGENAEKTAYREVEEEIGVKLDSLEYAGTYWFEKGQQLMHGFIGRTKKRAFSLSKEVDMASWVSLDEAESRMFPPREGNAQYELYKMFKLRC